MFISPNGFISPTSKDLNSKTIIRLKEVNALFVVEVHSAAKLLVEMSPILIISSESIICQLHPVRNCNAHKSG